MRKKTNPFIQRKQEAAKAPAPATETIPEPDPNAMSDEQLDNELKRAKEDLRRFKEQQLVSTREAAEAAKPKSKPERTRPLFPSKRRKQWK